MEDAYTFLKNKYKNPSPVLKNEIKSPLFFRYIFFEYPNLKSWNDKLHLIKLSVFKNKIKVLPTFKNKIDSLFITNLLPLKKHIANILKDGWKKNLLSITEYNFIVLFIDFYNKIEAFSEAKEFSTKTYLKMEEAFLKIAINQKNIDIICKGIEKYLENNCVVLKINEFIIKDLAKNLNFFFSKDFYNPSLYDLVLSYNMVVTAKYLKWDELIYSNEIKVIQEGYYNCSKEVIEEIKVYLRKAIKSLETLKSEKNRIEKIIQLSSADDETNPKKIITFYQILGLNWETDNNNFFYLAYNLLEGIFAKVKTLINNEWDLMNQKQEIVKIKIKSSELESLLSDSMQDFSLLKERYTSTIITKFKVHDIVTNQNPQTLFTTTNEKYIFDKFQAILYTLYKTAERLREQYLQESGNENMHQHMKYMIITPADWKSRPAYEVFHYYMSLFYQICKFFNEKNLRNEINRLEQIEKLIIKKEETIKSSCDREKYMEKFIREEMQINE